MNRNCGPFKYYLGLESLHGQLEQIMSPTRCYGGLDYFDSTLLPGDGLVHERGLPLGPYDAADPLELIRCDAHEDFRNNGVERELDVVDHLQQKLRSAEKVESPVQNCVHIPSALNVHDQISDFADQKNRRKNKKAKLKTVCVFCKNNGERVAVYSSHILKDETGKVRCPVLRKYTCPLCGVTGDSAHTIRYCPKSSNTNTVASMVLSTMKLSTGKLNPRRSEKPFIQ